MLEDEEKGVNVLHRGVIREIGDDAVRGRAVVVETDVRRARRS